MDDSDTQRFDEERAAAYDERIRRLVPGYESLQASIAAVLGRSLGAEAHVLVVGAGTGAEIVEMAGVRPRWRFTAVDPSAEMLERCRRKVRGADLGERVEFVCDPIQKAATDGRCDAATSIFVAHFIEEMAAKRRYFDAIAERLVPGAPLIVADAYDSSPGAGSDRLMAAWRESFRQAGATAEEAEKVFTRMPRQISFVEEADLEALLDNAGFDDLVRFFQHFQWGAWWAEKRGM